MITNVLINLIRNARQAIGSENKGVIRLNAEKTENKIILSVKDNGPGIPDEIKEEIFMPFFTTREKGSGVGLSYSRQVMNISFLNILTHLCSFVIFIPASPAGGCVHLWIKFFI